MSSGALHEAASSPITLGAALGLALGKPIGISLFSYAAIRLGIASLPEGARWSQLVAVSMIAGVGFTVSLFVTSLAFQDALLVADAKIGILAGSLVVGAIGFVVLGRQLPTGASERS